MRQPDDWGDMRLKTKNPVAGDLEKGGQWVDRLNSRSRPCWNLLDSAHFAVLLLDN